MGGLWRLIWAELVGVLGEAGGSFAGKGSAAGALPSRII